MKSQKVADQGADAKRLLRRDMRAALAKVSALEARRAGDRIAEALLDLRAWQDAAQLALFSSLPGEVDTAPIWEAARRASKRVLFPRMIPENRLEFAAAEEVSQLEPGRFGVLQPRPECTVHALNADTLILVPGLAFDQEGGRLGRGAGYYDRTLSAAELSTGRRAGRWGVGFGLQLVSVVPMGRHDIRMDGVLTEAGWSEVG